MTSIAIHPIPMPTNPISKLEQRLEDKIPTKLSDLEMDITIDGTYDDSWIQPNLDIRNVTAVDIDSEVDDPKDIHVTKDYVDSAIQAAITITLNTLV